MGVVMLYAAGIREAMASNDLEKMIAVAEQAKQTVREQKDLSAVLAYLNGLGTVSKIGLWGRSMGASTSIMYMADNQDTVHAAVLDSGFSHV